MRLNERRIPLTAVIMGLGLMLASLLVRAGDFDQQHTVWNRLLQDHVVWIRGGVASQTDYDGFAADRQRLDQYLASLSAVTETQYQSWTRNQKLAFLINAYNAFTVQLILDHYPGIESIKDIGGWFGSPWKQDFFELRGKKHSLDDIEQTMIRQHFKEPRIHMAVNCASIGCPALADTAYVASDLDAQLTQAVNRFLSDHSRNRYDDAGRTFKVSSIFDWYGADWNADSGYPQGVRGFLVDHLSRLSEGATPPRLEVRGADIEYLDYDWSLNKVAPGAHDKTE